MSGTLSVKNEDVEQAIHDLTSAAQQVGDLQRMFNVAIVPLKAGGWRGMGADAFYEAADKDLIKEAAEARAYLDNFTDFLRMALEIVKTTDELTATKPLTEMEQAMKSIGQFFGR